MIYKIILSSGSSIAIENEEDLQKVMKAINEPNAKLIITKHGIFNLSFLVSITADDEAESKMNYARKSRNTEQSALESVVGRPVFAQLIEQMRIGNEK